MPYIQLEDRDRVLSQGPTTPGELNYAFTMLALLYIENNVGKVNYLVINDIIGALEGCKLEFYRRVASPYEDIKIEQNGDVYPNG